MASWIEKLEGALRDNQNIKDDRLIILREEECDEDEEWNGGIEGNFGEYMHTTFINT